VSSPATREHVGGGGGAVVEVQGCSATASGRERVLSSAAAQHRRFAYVVY